MAIRIAEDVGIPALVAVADYGTERLDKGKAEGETKINPIMGMVLAAAGYALTAFGIGGDYTKNLGIASMDWGVRGLRSMLAARGVVTSSPTSSRLAMSRRVKAKEAATYPTYKPEEEVVFSVT